MTKPVEFHQLVQEWLKTEFSLSKITHESYSDFQIIFWKGFAVIRIEYNNELEVYDYGCVIQSDPVYQAHDPELFNKIKFSVEHRLRRINVMSL